MWCIGQKWHREDIRDNELTWPSDARARYELSQLPCCGFSRQVLDKGNIDRTANDRLCKDLRCAQVDAESCSAEQRNQTRRRQAPDKISVAGLRLELVSDADHSRDTQAG